MKRLACTVVLRELQPYYDGELQVADQIAVAAHLDGCDDCREALAGFDGLGSLLRAEAPGHRPMPCDEAASFVSGVVNRARAEDDVSFVAWVRDMFDDRRVVYSALGATTATLACLVIMLTMMRFGAGDRTDSLAGMLNVLAGPPVPVQPVVIRPIVLDARVRIQSALDSFSGSGVSDFNDSVLALSGVVTTEGRVSNIEVNDGTDGVAMASMDSKRIETLVDAMSKTRFEPVMKEGDPVTVNMVWFVAHTTVRGTGRRHLNGPQFAGRRRNVV
ncbi:MAG TPA: zf-HC2 domain-containing protein [Vicinamibacterales bacterium]|nr:zf-HC2 domain-containing protein [Vicinamibacterales bacterium]